MLIGSEGILGVITEAWVRVRKRPAHKASCGVTFGTFREGAEAVRAISQSGLNPANCRLLDPLEALTTGAGKGDTALLILGFESPFAPVDAQLKLAIDCATDHGGKPGQIKTTSDSRGEAGEGPPDTQVAGQGAAAPGQADRGRRTSGGPSPASHQPSAGTSGGASPPSAHQHRADAVDTWKHAFLAAPYLRDSFVAMGILSETFETATTWDNFGELHGVVTEAARRAVADVVDAPTDGPGAPRVSCRFTHVYPDGPAPYFTILAPARRGSEVAQWDEIKAAVSEALISAGGTITHHHAVGRDHRPWYDLQRPDQFAEALAAAKAAVDPSALLNPGVLIDPERREA